MSKSPKPEARRLRNVTLFSDADEAVPSPSTVPLARIIISATQPRRYFAPEAMQVLVESVKKDGVLQPILVRPLGDKYELVAGERRYRAAKSAGLTDIPAVVREMSDSEAVRFALMENLQREDLNPVEETEGILELLAITLDSSTAEVTLLLQRLHKEIKRKKLSHNVMGQLGESVPSELAIIQSVFDSLGRMSWESFTSNRLPLLNLPADILEALQAGRLEYTKAKEIAKLESGAERQELLEEASADSLSLSQIRERVKASQPSSEPPPLAARIDATTKRVKKSKVWENPSKLKKLEILLAQLEELISEEGLDESQPIGEAEAPQEQPQPTVKSSEESSSIESEKDSLERRKDVTEKLTSESQPPLEETPELPDERETPSSEPLDEFRLDTEEEPTHKGSELTDELLNSSLTPAELVERLGVKSSTLSVAKKKPNFWEWSKSKDPDALAWQWLPESKRFVPLIN